MKNKKKLIILDDNYSLHFLLKLSSVITEEVVIKGVRASDRTPVAQTTLQKKTIQNVYNGEHPVFFLNELTPSIIAESDSRQFSADLERNNCNCLYDCKWGNTLHLVVKRSTFY